MISIIIQRQLSPREVANMYSLLQSIYTGIDSYETLQMEAYQATANFYNSQLFSHRNVVF